ncbi:hypothetical protein ROHU_000493 [Labeo rohita]|uniref:Uncharacterized protein n=1 Tax=Labeo rohita TaxID=84645 RepID=A0A498P4H5_LABRO|nr:hypothetical protein ROHU_000493 [Labeo rohita]
MARSKTLTLLSITFAFIASVEYIQASEKKEECPAKQEISCETLRTAEGFTYLIPMNIPNSGHCEYAWYQKNGTCIAHSGGKILDSVVAMTPNNLIVSICEDLRWQLDCDSIPKLHCIVDYKVIDPEKKQNYNAGLPGWGIALLVTGIVVVIVGALIAVCFYSRNHENSGLGPSNSKPKQAQCRLAQSRPTALGSLQAVFEQATLWDCPH